MGLFKALFGGIEYDDNISGYDEDELNAYGLDEEEKQLVRDGVCSPDDFEKEFDESLYCEKELDSYGLDENEKELVRKGDYDPWQFEEEDTDEDDYYAEDDI